MPVHPEHLDVDTELDTSVVPFVLKADARVVLIDNDA